MRMTMSDRGVYGLMVLSLFLVSCGTEPAGSLPATGQGEWYQNNGNIANCDDSTGLSGPINVPPMQDGRINAGCPMEGRFEVINGQVVRDTCTNLMWQKVSPSAPNSWGEAQQFASDLMLAGFDDWRAPNVHELLSIVHYGRTSPAVDAAFLFTITGDDVDGVRPGSSYWSSTSSNINPRQAWVVNFDQGDHFVIDKTVARAVRAVRGGYIPRKLQVLACSGVASP
jgi:hypothetical protein